MFENVKQQKYFYFLLFITVYFSIPGTHGYFAEIPLSPIGLLNYSIIISIYFVVIFLLVRKPLLRFICGIAAPFLFLFILLANSGGGGLGAMGLMMLATVVIAILIPLLAIERFGSRFLILHLLAIILLLGTLLGVYRGYITPHLSTIIKQAQEGQYSNSFLMAFQCKMLGGNVENSDFCVIKVAEHEQNPFLCRLVKHSNMRARCYNATIKDHLQRLSYCEKLLPSSSAYAKCVTMIAVEEGNITSCEKLSDEKTGYSECIRGVAIDTQNLTLCSNPVIQRYSSPKICEQLVRERMTMETSRLSR